MRIFFYAPNCFEPWDWRNPDDPGIGGSETAVVELSRRLARRGHQVVVYGRLRHDTVDDPRGPVSWQPLEAANTTTLGMWVICRSPKSIDLFEPTPQQQLVLQCQDTLYSEATGGGDITEARAAKLRYILALSPTHRDALASIYPFAAEKICLSSNGIKTDAIHALPDAGRDPYRLVWASSPDRGLEATLRVFNRAREMEPRLTLHVCYGWDNIDKLIAQHGENGPWAREKRKALALCGPGVVLRGRLGQRELWLEYLQAGLWVYCTAFCVAGDTLIDMPRDYSVYPKGVPIASLVGKSGFPIWTYDEEVAQFKLSPVAWVKQTVAAAEVCRVRWDDGSSITLTPDHLVLTWDRGWIPARDLQAGESVVALHKHVQVQIGIGQGVRGRSWPTEHRLIAEHLFGPIPKGHHVDHIDGNPWNNTPSNLQILSSADHARKTFRGQPTHPLAVEKRVAGWRKWAESHDDQIKAHLGGIAKRFWASMSPDERKAFVSKRKVRIESGQRDWLNSLTDEQRSEIGRGGREARWNHRVVSVEMLGECIPVFDLQIENGPHNFIANGVVVHNCETSCISCMEAQALGAIPIFTPLWALRSNVRYGIAIEGHNMDGLTQARYVAAILRLVRDPALAESIRQPMMPWAREHFDWEHVVDQYEALAGVPVAEAVCS